MKVKNRQLDHGDLVILTMYHKKANPTRGIKISDINDLINLAESFYAKYSEANWEECDWEEKIIKHYNIHCPHYWDKIH